MDVLIIAVAIATLLFIPLFRFFILVFSTLDILNKAKETLEIASMSTYTELNRNCLGDGILEMEESSAIAVFNQQIVALTAGNPSLCSMKDIDVIIIRVDGMVKIDSKATILSAFNQPVQVEHSLEFVIDPIMEGS